MTFMKASAVLLALASSVVAFPTFVNPWAQGNAPSPSYTTAVVESLTAPPRGWALDDTKDVDKDEAVIKLRMHLVHQDMDKFREVALNIATPGHSMYGGHMSQKEIDGIIAPKDESGAMVMEWLETMGLSSHAYYTKRRDSIVVEAPVAQIEKLLDAEYSLYSKWCDDLLPSERRSSEQELTRTPIAHSATGNTVLRTLEFSLPTALKGHVDNVQPTTFFGFRSYKSAISSIRPIEETETKTDSVAAVTGCASSINPTCLSNLYSFADAEDYTSGLFGIAGFL